MSKSTAQYKKFYDYLTRLTLDEYHARLLQIIHDYNLTDYSIAEFNNKMQVVSHRQTAPAEMLEAAYCSDEPNLVAEYAIRNNTKSHFLSDLATEVESAEILKKTFSGFISTTNILNKYGYTDFLNIAANAGGDRAVLFSVSRKNTTTNDFKKIVTNNNSAIDDLSNVVATMHHQYHNQATILLTKKQIQLISIISKNDCNLDKVAEMMHISTSTLKTHLTNIGQVVGVCKTWSIVAWAIREGII